MGKKQKVEKQDDVKVEAPSVDNEEFEKLKVDFDNLQNQLKRAVADYQNLEKRVAEGRSEFTSWATTELVRKLLPVLDHLEQAINGVSEEERQSGWLKGVELAVKEFKNVLQAEGVQSIDVEIETLFDPSLHEAVNTKEGQYNMILEVVRKGYNLNGKILRPAQVVVGNGEKQNG